MTHYSPSCRSDWNEPVKGVELHGQHGVSLQGWIGVIGCRSRLLTQLSAINRSRNQALQDLLQFRKKNQREATGCGQGGILTAQSSNDIQVF